MAPNYYQLIEMAPKIKDAIMTDTLCTPEDVHIEFIVSYDELQKINKFFYQKMNPEEDAKDLNEVKAMNVKLCGINFTYKIKEEENEQI